MNYIAQTDKKFDEVLKTLQNKVAENGFRVLHIHNVQQTLKEKGFEIEEYSIVEICNAKFAYQVLSKDKEYGVMMPCKINVYAQNGKVWLSLPLPSELAERFEMNGVENIAKEVEEILKKIMDSSI